MGGDQIWSYIGIRADENRSGYISAKPNITPVYPFKEHGLVMADIERLLDESGLGRPTYYEWRQRSGCYFCFFQRTSEWAGLKERHPDLFEKAKGYEVERGRYVYRPYGIDATYCHRWRYAAYQCGASWAITRIAIRFFDDGL